MSNWFLIAICTNAVCWTVFLYLLIKHRARLTKGALAVGLLHMLFAALVSVAPFRSWLDPNYGDLGLGFMTFSGRAATLPATLLLTTSLASAWLAVGRGRGRWLALVVACDLFHAANLGGATLLEGRADNWKVQLGEYASLTGLPAALLMLALLALPFAASAIWALRRARTPRDPHALSHDDARDQSGEPRNDGDAGTLRCVAAVT